MLHLQNFKFYGSDKIGSNKNLMFNVNNRAKKSKDHARLKGELGKLNQSLDLSDKK